MPDGKLDLFERALRGDQEAWAKLLLEEAAEFATFAPVRIQDRDALAADTAWFLLQKYSAERCHSLQEVRALVKDSIERRALDKRSIDLRRESRIEWTADLLDEIAPERILSSEKKTEFEAALDRKDEEAIFEAALIALPLGQSEVLRMRYLEALRDSQIAERLGISLVAVQRRARRALRILRESPGFLGRAVSRASRRRQYLSKSVVNRVEQALGPTFARAIREVVWRLEFGRQLTLPRLRDAALRGSVDPQASFASLQFLVAEGLCTEVYTWRKLRMRVHRDELRPLIANAARGEASARTELRGIRVSWILNPVAVS